MRFKICGPFIVNSRSALTRVDTAFKINQFSHYQSVLLIGKYSLLKSQFRWQQFQVAADTGFNSSHEMRGAISAVTNTGWQQHMNRRQELWPLMIVQWVVECRGKSNLGSTEENEMSVVEKMIFNWNFYVFSNFWSAKSRAVSKLSNDWSNIAENRI